MGERYTYQGLSAGAITRVLTLEASNTFSAPLRCSLREVFDLEKPPKYGALSYFCGPLTGDQPVLCDGKTMLITKNCELALRYLRDKVRPRTLWVDSICIDQKPGSKEKGAQIQKMGDIYQRADRVYIWLGEPTSETAALFRRIRCLGRVLYHTGFLYRCQLLGLVISLLFGNRKDAQSFTRLCAHDWFERAWTFQEFLLARRPLALSGNLECPMKWLFACVPWFQRPLSGLERSMSINIFMRDLAAKLYSMFKSLATLRRNRWLRALAEKIHKPTGIDVILFLQLSRVNGATDSRDKVYAMLPLLSKILSQDVFSLQIEYKMTTETVYEEFARRAIQSYQDLAILFCHTNHKNLTALPSWVPDWTLSLDLSDLLFIDTYLPNKRNPKTEIDLATMLCSAKGQLALRGREFATIDLVGGRHPKDVGDEDDAYREGMATFNRDNDRLIYEFNRKTGYTDGFGEFYEFDRLDSLDSLDKVRVRHSKPAWNLKSLFSPNFNPGAVRKNHIAFATEKHLGLSRGDVRVNDVVVLLKGGFCPYILRPLPIHPVLRGLAQREGRKYQYIGDTFMHGVPEPHTWFNDTGNDLATFILV